GEMDHACQLNGPTDSLNSSAKTLFMREREVNDRLVARSHVSKLGFAEICNDVPFARVKQREYRNPGGNMGPGRNVEVDDPSGKRCDDLAVGEMEFLEIDSGDRTFALSLYGCYCGSGFVDSVGGGKAMGQEWFQ